jgi:hypothetical protein
MADEWYIDAGGRLEGPFTATELNARAADGRLGPTAAVSRDRAQWVAAGTVPALKFPPRPRPLQETVVSGSIDTGAKAADRPPTVLPTVSVPGYQILDVLGTGACGVVYRARQEKLNRTVALKTVLVPEKASGDLLERFKQEAVALARLQHPNVVAVYDSGLCETPKGQVFFAMELLDGEDLDQRVERSGPLPERTAWLVARQTAAALGHAARLGVVHRDVKPANLFLVPPPTGFPLPPDVPMVKVTDFGLALTRGPAGDTEPRQTATGVLLGTPVYMAPEQFTGSDVDLRADIYSLGATVYHALTGDPPYAGRTVYEVMKKKSAPAPRLPPPTAADTADLVAAMMAEDPADRPASYEALLARIDALACLEGGFSFSGLPTASGRMAATRVPAPAALAPAVGAGPTTPRKRLRFALAALAALGIAVAAAVLAGGFTRPDQPVPAVTYTVGSAEVLFDGHSVLGWAGPGLTIDADEEHNPVLAVESAVTRQLRTGANFRVVVALDRYKAATAEVVVATAGSARWLVRLDAKDGVAFGKRTAGGVFEPVSAPIPYPPAKPNQPPYLELKYERAGDTLAAWFDSQPLGRAPADGLTATEFRIHATGGPVRIEYAEAAELVPVK